MVQVTSLECGGCISASSSLSLLIEGVCSELVQTRCFRFSRGRVASISTGHLSLIRLTYRPVKTCLLASCTQTRRRRKRGRKREGVLARTWRIKRTDRAEANAGVDVDVENDKGELRSASPPKVVEHRVWRVYRTNHPVPLLVKKGTDGTVAVSSNQEISCPFNPANRRFLSPSPDRYYAEQKHRKKRLPHGEPFHAGGIIITKCLQNCIDYGLISGTCTSSTSIAKPSRQSS